MTPNDVQFYSEISALLSHIREASSCSSQEKMQRPTARHYAESETH